MATNQIDSSFKVNGVHLMPNKISINNEELAYNKKCNKSRIIAFDTKKDLESIFRTF